MVTVGDPTPLDRRAGLQYFTQDMRIKAVRGTVRFDGVPTGATVKILDSSGRQVCVLCRARANGGIIEWNGKSDRGARCPRGAYWCVVSDSRENTGGGRFLLW